MFTFSSVKEAREVIYSLSSPSKMPGYAWSIPPEKCRVGSILAGIEGSTCSMCYAKINRYAFPGTINAMQKRLDAMTDPRWLDAMTCVLRSKAVLSKAVFRWFDAGDLQNADHLDSICELARRTPEMRHWLPTREVQLLKNFALSGKELPGNLTVRLSAQMIDGAAPRFWPWTSGVHRHSEARGEECPAPSQGGKCGSCRKCWDRDVAHVSYHFHYK